MKKTKKNAINKSYKNDEKFAKKVVIQSVLCVIVYIVIFVNSRLTNPVSVRVNESIKHHLCVSLDFKKMIETARMHIEGIMNKKQTVPVDSDSVWGSKEDN